MRKASKREMNPCSIKEKKLILPSFAPTYLPTISVAVVWNVEQAEDYVYNLEKMKRNIIIIISLTRLHISYTLVFCNRFHNTERKAWTSWSFFLFSFLRFLPFTCTFFF